MKKTSSFFKNFFNSDKNVALLLLPMFFFGLIIILQQVCVSIVKESDLQILDGIIGFFPETRKYILWYIISVPAIFLLWISALIYKKFFWEKLTAFFSLLRKKGLIQIGALAVFILNLFFVVYKYDGKGEIWFVFFLLWLIAYFLPLLVSIKFKKPLFFERPFAKKYFYIITIISCFIYLCWMMKPFIIDKLRIINEYWDIPTETLLQDGTTFDNTEYINNNKLIGFHEKYDIRKDNDKPFTVYAKIKNNKHLQNYIKYATERDRSVSPFFYEEGKGLCIILPIQDKYKAELLGLGWTDAERKALNDAFIELIQQQKMLENYKSDKEYKKKVRQFVRNNEYEILWQIYNRWYIHHNNHLIGAVNELNLGRPINEIFMQYGFLNAYFIQKILSAAGQVNYGAYEKLLYSFYPAYIIILAFFILLITKKNAYISLILLITIAGYNFLTFHYFYMDAGINPVRHFFDIPLLIFLYLYLNREKKIFYILSLLTCMLAVTNNIQFGLVLTLAFAITVIAKDFKRTLKKPVNFETVLLFITIICCIILALIFQQGSLNITMGFLSGILNLPIPAGSVILVLTLAMISYFAFLYLKKIDKNLALIFFLVLLYSQGLLVFFFRSYAFFHILPFIMIYTLPFLIALKIIFSKYPKYENTVLFLINAALIILFIFSVVKYTKPMRAFNRALDNNKLYEWTLPGTNFISDMDPESFKDSAELIKKYSPDEKAIYIISKYDNFIPLISERYSALPYIDLQWYLATKQDFDNVVSSVQKAAPKYIFADKDLETRNFEYDLVNYCARLGFLHRESFLRVQRMNQIQRVFKELAGDYKPVESSLLLTVYERK